MDGRHQSADVPQGGAQQQQVQQPKQQREQRQVQHVQQQHPHGQHYRRYRPHYEQRMQHYHTRVQQLQCRSQASRQHQDGKRGNNDAGPHLVCESKPLFHRQRSLADKVPEGVPLGARNRLARSRSTPWSLDESDHSKAKPEIGDSAETTPQPKELLSALPQESTTRGDERCRANIPAAARLRRLHSYGSVDTSNKSNHAGNLQTNANGFNRRHARHSSHSAHRGRRAAGSSPSGNWCVSSNNITTNDCSNTSCSNSVSKGAQGDNQLRAFYKKSVSFDCTLESESKNEICSSRKDGGYSRPSLQQCGAQHAHDSRQAEEQLQAAEGCELSAAKEPRCCCASEGQLWQPDRSRLAVGTAQVAHNGEIAPTCFQRQTQLQQHHPPQKHVQRRTLQQQKSLHPLQQARQQQQQNHEQWQVGKREIRLSPERTSATNVLSEQVPSQQLLVQEQPLLSEDRSPPDSRRSEHGYLHSPAQRLPPSAFYEPQHHQQQQEQHSQGQIGPQQCQVTEDLQPLPQQKRDCLPPAYYSLQWPPSASMLYCQHLQQLPAGPSSFYEKEMSPCPDPLLHSVLLHVPGNLCVSSQHVYSGSVGPPSLLQLGVAPVQGPCVRDTTEVFERHVCLSGQTTSPFSSVSGPQSSASPSVLSPRPADECDFCNGDVGKGEEQGAALSAPTPFYFPSPPPGAPSSPAAAATSSRSYPAMHAPTNDKRSPTTIAKDEGYCVPAPQLSSANWTGAVGGYVHNRNNVSYLRDVQLVQQVKHSAADVARLKEAGNTAEPESGNKASAIETVADASQHGGGNETFAHSLFAGSPKSNAAGTLTEHMTVAAYTATDTACISSVEGAPGIKLVRAASATSLHDPSGRTGCLRSAAAPDASDSNSPLSELTVRNQPEFEEEGPQCVSSGSELRSHGVTTTCTARHTPVPSRFPLAFPPKDKSLLLPPGAPLVSASSGTTNGGVDNKDHDYIARQYEFILPDHLLTVAAPLDTSAQFFRSSSSTASVTVADGADTHGPATSAPTADSAASISATGHHGCAAARVDTGGAVVDFAESGVLLKSSIWQDHQGNVCSAATTQMTREGSVCEANAEACVLSSVHPTLELPRTLRIQLERLSNKKPAGAFLQQPTKASGIKRSCSSIMSLFEAARAPPTHCKKLDLLFYGRHQKTAVYPGRAEVTVERFGEIEDEGKAEKRHSEERAAAESAAALLQGLEGKEQGVDKRAEGPQAIQRQRKMPATIATLELQTRANSLPARGVSRFRKRTIGGRTVRGNVPECLARIASAGSFAVLSAAHQRAQDKQVRCAANTPVHGTYRKTELPCASSFVHAKGNSHASQQEIRATKEKWSFASDEGTQLNMPRASPTASIISDVGKEKDEKAGKNEVSEADVPSESNKFVLQCRPRCTQEKSTSQQETHGRGPYGRGPYGARAVSCENCSPPNSCLHNSNNKSRSSGSVCCYRGRHRLHYYQVLRLLGRGTFGHVYECLQYDARSGEAVAAVAVKIVKNDEAYTRSAMQEIAILRQLNGESCRYNCNCKTASGEAANGEENNFSSSCVRAPIGETVISGGGRDDGRVPSDEEWQRKRHQSGAGLQPQDPDRQQEQGEREMKEQLDADVGKRRVVKLLDDFTYYGHTCLVFELLQTDLYQLLKKNRFFGFPLPAVKQVCRELLQGLAHLKRTRIVHCDVKPENILVRFSGPLPAPEQQEQTQWHQHNQQQLRHFLNQPPPFHHQHPPSLQAPQQEGPQPVQQIQRRSSWQAAAAAEVVTQQEELASVNVSDAVQSAFSSVPARPARVVSTCSENLHAEEKSSQCGGICQRSSMSPSGDAGSAAVADCTTEANKATAPTPAADLPLLLEVCPASSGPSGTLLSTGNSSPLTKDDNCLAPLPELRPVRQSGASSSEACLSLPKLGNIRPLTSSTSLGCTTTAAGSRTSCSACRTQAVRRSHCNTGNMPRIADTPATGDKNTHTTAGHLQVKCAPAPPRAVTVAASCPGTSEEMQMAAGSISRTAATANVCACAGTSPAARLSISVKLVDFSSAYPLPPRPQPVDPQAIEALEHEQASHPAAPYLYAQSRFYGAPEVMLGVHYMGKLDVWAVGCVAAELYSGKPLLPGATDFDQIRRLVALRGIPPAWMLRAGRRTSLYFARDQGRTQQQKQAKVAKGDEQRRLQQKDEEDKRHEKHETRPRQHREGMCLAPQEEQQQQKTEKQRQRRKQQHLDDRMLVHKGDADKCRKGDEETKKKRGSEQELAQHQEPSLAGKNRQAEKPVAEGTAQGSVLNSSCAVAGETAAARAFVRGGRWGALSAGPCGLPRRQIQAWWHRVLVAVSPCSIVEKKSQQDACCRVLQGPHHEARQEAETPHQQQRSAEAPQQHQQGRKQNSQTDVTAGAPSQTHQQQPEECCQATAAMTNQQQHEIQYTGTTKQKEESSFLPSEQGRKERALPDGADYQQQTYEPLMSAHPAGHLNQASARARTELRGRSVSSGSHGLSVKTRETQDGAGQAIEGEKRGGTKRTSLEDRTLEAGRCAQNAAGKAESKNEAARGQAAADQNSRSRVQEALRETEVAHTSNKGQGKWEEENTGADTDGRCCSSEGDGWRLKTAQEAGEGTSSRDGTPRGAPVLRSLQELVTMRKQRERLQILQVDQRERHQMNDGESSAHHLIPGCSWPTTNEGVLLENTAECRHATQLKTTACPSKSYTSEKPKIRPGTIRQTSEQFAGVSGAYIKFSLGARTPLCMSSKNSHSAIHSAARLAHKELPACGNACLHSSSCVRGADLEAAVQIKAQGGEGCLLSRATKGGCVLTADFTNDNSKEERLFNSALGSGGVGRPQKKESAIKLAPQEIASRKNTAAATVARKSDDESVTSTSIAQNCSSSGPLLRQTLSKELKTRKTKQSQECGTNDAEKPSSSCDVVQGLTSIDSSAPSSEASPVRPGSLSGGSAAAFFRPAAPSTSPLNNLLSQGGWLQGGWPPAAAVANASIIAFAPSPSSRCQGQFVPPRVFAPVSPHQTPGAAATTTTLPQAIANTRDNFPKRASRFFKKLMMGRSSRPSSSSYSEILYSKNGSAAQTASTYKQEGFSERSKDSSCSSGSSPPAALHVGSASSCPPVASPAPCFGNHRADVSSPSSTFMRATFASTQQIVGEGDAICAAASSHSPASSGTAGAVAPATATAASTASLETSHTATDSSPASSLLNNAAFVQIPFDASTAEGLHPSHSCSRLCNAPPPPACFPAVDTMALPHPGSSVSATRCYSSPSTPSPVLPTDPSPSPAAAPAFVAGVAGALLHAAPRSCVTAAAPASAAFAASDSPTAVVSASAVDSGGASDASPLPVASSSSVLPPSGDAAALPPLRSVSSWSAAARLLSASFPPFPSIGGSLRKDTSTASTACSTTACSCCSQQHTDAAAADPAAVVDTQVATAAAGAAPQQQESDTSREAELASASSGALAITASEKQAEEERQEQLFLDFLDGMLQIDPFKRFTVEEALRHPFIAEDFCVAPTAAANFPATGAPLPAPTPPTQAGRTTAALYTAVQGRQGTAGAPRGTEAPPPARGEVKTAEAAGAAARALVLQQKRNFVEEQEEHSSPPVSELDVAHSSKAAAVCISAVPVARDPQMALATASRIPTTIAADLLSADALPAPLLQGNLPQLNSFSSGDTHTQKLIQLAPASPCIAMSSSRSDHRCSSCHRCYSAAVQDDVAVPHCAGRTSTAHTTFFAGAVVSANNMPVPVVAVTSDAAGTGAGATAPAVAVAVAPPPPAFCSTADYAWLSTTFLRERAVDAQYRIWSSRRFKDVVDRLREDASALRQATAVTKQQETAAVETATAEQNHGGQEQQPSSLQQQTAHASRQQARRESQNLADAGRKAKDVRPHHEQQDNTCAAALKRTKEEADATKVKNESWHVQEYKVSNGSRSGLRGLYFASTRQKKGTSSPRLVTEQFACISGNAWPRKRSTELTLPGRDTALGEDLPHLSRAAAGSAAVATMGDYEDNERIHKNMGRHWSATKMSGQLQDVQLLHHLQNVLQEEALKARHLAELQALRHKQIKELEELRRKRRVTLPIQNAPNTNADLTTDLHKARNGT